MKRLIFVGAALFVMAQGHAVRACASMGDGPEPVRVSQESAIIVWDEAHHREHFIRRASFQTKSRDVGFLVPTPSTPELAEANDAAFTEVGQAIAPRVVYKINREYRFTLFPFVGVKSEDEADTPAGNAASADGVTMLFAQHVAGYDAVVLAAEDVRGLGRWLKAHGYQTSPALMKWLAPYVQKRWKITAFKIPKADASSQEFSSTPVRMSFDTPRPFFPYSEPQTTANQSPESRWLQVFLFAPQRMEGRKGENSNSHHWPGTVDWADVWSPVQHASFTQLLALPGGSFSSPQWLTVFNDRSSPRHGDADVFFAADTNNAEPILPPPIVRERDETVVIQLGWVAIALAFLSWIFLSWRGNRKASR